VHERVEEEARTGEVADVLEDRHEEEKRQKIRQDDGYPAADPWMSPSAR